VSNGLPTKAKVGIPGKSVSIDTATYFVARRMESVGMLRPGQAFMLAATLPKQVKAPKKDKRK
jgi:hypothetical protein